MKLSAYIESMGATLLAEKLGLSSQAVHYWKSEECAPSPEQALKIVTLSSGIVSWEEIYLPIALKRLNIRNPRQLKLF